MDAFSPAVHRTIFVVDVEGFGARRRINPDQVAIREGLYRVLREAFVAAGMRWDDCYREDRGDGVLVLISPEVPKQVVAARLPGQLSAALRRHNRACAEVVRIRLRVAVHAGEVHFDEHGVVGTAINMTFRLLEAAALRSALAASPGVVALIASEWFFEEVVRHDPASVPAAYRRAWVAVKETHTTAWVRLPDQPTPPNRANEVALTCDYDGRIGDLPAELTSFVGRAAEVAEIKRLLSRSRLVTLTGPGGVGKTRIALRVAADLRNSYADGVYLVELSGLRDPELLTDTVATALGLPGQTARPAIEILADYLKNRRVLLVLDTCEHIIDPCAALANVLLRGTTDVDVLITSRQPLDSAGEHVISIRPMRVPPDDDEPFGRAYDAVTLFADRAVVVQPDFAVTEDNWPVVAAVCRRLDGIPLAIELAVVRLRVFSAEQMVPLLDDRFRLLTRNLRTAPERQQTLRTAIDWSHELCAPEERLLWARLSVFAGDFDLSAAQQICASGELPADQLLVHLANLVDKSIVIRVETNVGTRYRLLDTIREYGRERMVALGEEPELRRRHRELYLAMARRFDEEWLGSGQVAWIRRLNAERPNLRMAMEFCLGEPGAAMVGLTMATTLWGYWLCSARLSEGRHWFDRGLRLLPEPTPTRARALWLTGWFAIAQGDHPAGEPLFEESRAIAIQTGDDSALAYAIQYLGGVYMFRGEAARSLVMYEDALARLRVLEDRPGLVIITFQLGMCLFLNGHPTRALAACDESLRLNGDNDERWCRGWALYIKGLVFWMLSEYRTSAEMISACLRMKHELGDIQGIAHCLEVLGWGAAQEVRHQRAAWLMGAAHPLWQKIGLPLFGMEILRDHHNTAERRAQEALGRDSYAEIFQAGTKLVVDQAVNLALGDETLSDG
nr:AAA family ATPase [Kibdelosporangium sp. MJ126-NF4]CEL18238.1 possible protein kinase/ transcriptional regulator, LuxR family [Kibdelosporangium sp. MJ126-NF4]CTQ90531.1 possible protein kinase/ transcriptional regulator, LuxR family [Kibdelosporangium sp. MJ126-NF4]